MGLNINYTRRSTHLNHGLAKHKLDERREKQQLAQHRMEEAVKRAVRSTAGASTETCSTATNINGKRWAFSHARREGDRRMGAAVAYKSALSSSAYAVLPPQKLEKKKQQLLATQDWPSLSRSNSPPIRSRSLTLVQDDIKPETCKVKFQTRRSTPRPVSVPKPRSALVPKLEPVPASEVKIEVKSEETSQQKSSSIDIYMPSSPPQQSMALSSSVQSNFSSSFSRIPEAQEDETPSSQTLSAILSTQDPIATQGSVVEVPMKMEVKEEKPIEPFPNRAAAPRAGLQHLGPPYTYLAHIRDLYSKPIACAFLLPCMVGDANLPFIYDGIQRSSDYLGMSFAGPDMED